jgi:hypothetical protein
MVMSNFASKLWTWIFNRSPQQASNPKPVMPPDEPINYSHCEFDNQFESYSETQSIQGFISKLGWQETGARTPDGKLFRNHDSLALPIGCGHIVMQQQAVDQQDRHIRGIAGICFYCQQELIKASSRGEISLFDAERLSLVCSDCGKITVSGHLCCPKHYASVKGPDGKDVYLGPNEIKKQEQSQITARVLGPLLDLFSEDQPQLPQKRETDNAHNPD